MGAELSWHSFGSGLAFGFPPAGVDVAVLLLTARRYWPAVLAAIAVSEIGVDLQHHLTIAVALVAAPRRGVLAVGRADAGGAGGGRRCAADGGRAGRGACRGGQCPCGLRHAGRALAIAGHQPAGILGELARITEWATGGKYATMAAAIIEPDASRLTYATAGHPPILIRRARTGTVEIPLAVSRPG